MTTDASAPPLHAPTAPAATSTPTPAPASSSKGRRPLWILAALGALAVGGYTVHRVTTADIEETDDAQVEADVVPISARIGGVVLRVRVRDNQRVRRGDVIAEIDPAESAARVAQAEAELANAQAQLQQSEADAQLTAATASGGLRTARAVVSGAIEATRSAQAQIAAAEAGVTRAQALATQTRLALTRARALRADNAVSQAELDNAQSSDDAAQAAVAQAQAQLATARASRQSSAAQVGVAEGRLEQSAPVESQVAVAQARVAVARARVQSAQAALDLARLQHGYTQVVAPTDGAVARLGVREGQLLTAGQMLADLVPDETYLVANFKETQIGRMHPGQRVEVRVDAFPGRVFEGQIESLSGGTGARFSLLPADNASGNFVKVVQRVPVKITWTTPPDVTMRPGLSAEVTVHVGG